MTARLDGANNRRIMLATLAAGVTTIALFNMYPELDIEAARAFYNEKRGFVFRRLEWISVVRDATMVLYYTWYTICLVSLAATHFGKRMIAGFDSRDWLYLVLCSIAGPGVLTNGILKEVWGRARPRALEEFGRNLEFSPVLQWSQECSSNCSFVSGESSAMFMVFASLAFLLTSYRGVMFAAMVLFGGLVSLMRIGQGAHFLSDTIMAGVFMMLIAGLLYWMMYQRGRAVR